MLVCSNRHQTHIEFSFRKREDLCTALVEALREFILIAGIPARLQVKMCIRDSADASRRSDQRRALGLAAAEMYGAGRQPDCSVSIQPHGREVGTG